MILESFEIENWSCIGRLAIEDLPPTGIVVLHGPNGTGKSSLFAALRAALLDYSASSKSQELSRWYPKLSDEKPRVRIVFKAGGAAYRLTKKFGSAKDNSLELRTAAGDWKIEATTAADSHDRARQLLGGKDSDRGLTQLLWLSQAEIGLPEAKEFDGDTQSQLRGILGVLQTPLDDRFHRRIRDLWLSWYTARGKPGEKPTAKKTSALNLLAVELEKHRAELAKLDGEFRQFEDKMERGAALEIEVRKLQRDLSEKAAVRDALQAEYDRSQGRLAAHRTAQERLENARKERLRIRQDETQISDLQARLAAAEQGATAAERNADEAAQKLALAEGLQAERRAELQAAQEAARIARDRYQQLLQLQQLRNSDKDFRAAAENLKNAEAVEEANDEYKRRTAAQPAPSQAVIKVLAENRAEAQKLRAKIDAAAIAVLLKPEAAAPAANAVVDGLPSSASSLIVRRRAEIDLPGWGRIEISRGIDTRSLDEDEKALAKLDREYAVGLADFGLPPSDAGALDRLRGWAAEAKAREPELKQREAELQRLAPQGIDALRADLALLENKRRATAAMIQDSMISEEETDWERRLADAKEAASACEKRARDAEAISDEAAATVESLRKPANAAREARGQHAVLAAVLRQNLAEKPTAEQLAAQREAAETAVVRAEAEFEGSKLSDEENTVRDRLDSAAESFAAVQRHLDAVREELHKIEGALMLAEGLHPKRAAAAGRVEELQRKLDRETLDADACDRLLALFEECREKQLGTVMAPISDRVGRWLSIVNRDYQSIRFTDNFLPDKLLPRSGSYEMEWADESTGGIEQIALMVRLALGSALSTREEPQVAILDDPLTHGDSGRLDRMRGILRSAAAGDPTVTPEAGPLQIIVLTCHPERFAIAGAKIVDLREIGTFTNRS